MSEIAIALLDGGHDAAAFSCGEPTLDRWLKRHARPNHAAGLSRVFVATAPGSPTILGYYASCASSFQPALLPPDSAVGTPFVPAIHLGRLAIDSTLQGKGIGTTPLLHFLAQAQSVSLLTAVHAVDVFALSDAASAYYRKLGFLPLADNPRHLFMLMPNVRALLAA